jgi:hypothetical protein
MAKKEERGEILSSFVIRACSGDDDAWRDQVVFIP